MKLIIPCAILGSALALLYDGRYQVTGAMGIFLALYLFAFFFTPPRKRILKPTDDNRPFTSEELKAMGIVAPERYDCETFVR